MRSSRQIGVALLVAVVLLGSFELPSLTFFFWDRRNAGQIVTEKLYLRMAERESLNICHMLRMVYVTDKQTVLSKGKNLNPEEAFEQAKLGLALLEGLENLPIHLDTCSLQDYAITFRISSEDLSKRMILWALTITDGSVVLRVAMEDRTGTVLGFSYSNPEHPLYGSQIPPAESQMLGQTLIERFSSYWGVTIQGTTVVSGAGGYLLTVADTEHGLTAEIPYFLEQDGIRINLAG